MFVRGPKSVLVPASAVGSVIAYIHNNPVRAKLVAAASDSSWTSHRAYIGLGAVPRWLDVAEGLAQSGVDARAAFDQWADPARRNFDDLHDVAVSEDVAPAKRGDPPVADPDTLVAVTASELGISVAQLRSRRRTCVELRGRQAVVLCAQRVGLKGVETARALCLSQQAVSLIGARAIETEAIALAHCVLQRIDREA